MKVFKCSGKKFLTLSIIFLVNNIYPQILDLTGTWNVKLDRNDVGIEQNWFRQNFTEAIILPGILTAQGYGDPPSMNTRWTGDIRDIWFKDPYYSQYQKADNFKMPFWLQPDRHYIGAVWFQRIVEIPPDWTNKRVVLSLERPHWETTVWWQNQKIGTQNSLATPHRYTLGNNFSAGKYLLTVRVDNRMKINIGPNSHSISDHTQGNWNGIVGEITMNAYDPIWFEKLQIFPDFDLKKINIIGQLGNITEKIQEIVLTAQVKTEGNTYFYPQKNLTFFLKDPASPFIMDYDLTDNWETWDEFSPHLYELELQVKSEAYRDRKTVKFGLREVKTRGTQITLNDKPIFFRGTLECCIFPLTGSPPTDIEPWRRIITICKAHGLNHIRFHSWCPPEAAFFAADELGFYFQVECSSWANQGARLGSGEAVDDWIYRESEAIVNSYGNHPSFLLMAYGNEPGGPRHREYLSKFLTYWKQKDSRRLYTGASGWPVLPENQYHVSPKPRIQAWGQGLQSRVNASPPETITDYKDFIEEFPDKPVISHEIGQWCVYPNFEEIKKYTGLLKPKNFEIFREQLEKNGMLEKAKDFLMASGKLQALLYKEEIESALRTPGFAGFQLLDLHDFPGQGTALVGILDPFWDFKGYITPEEFYRFCGPVVPLARLPKRVFVEGENLETEIDLSQFAGKNLNSISPRWTIKFPDGQIYAEGNLKNQNVPAGQLLKLGSIYQPLNGFSKATKLNLEVSVPGTVVANDWDFWIYPKKLDEPESKDIYLSESFNSEVLQNLKAGKKVLLLPSPESIKGGIQGKVEMGFSSIFWNTVWTDRQPPHTLGILCNPSHPVLAEFPTEYHSNWQWWEIIHGAAPFILTQFNDLQPLVQVIDDWVTARKLALIFEAKVGEGKLIVCGADLNSQLNNRPVARQLRYSILNYMSSGEFEPKIEMTEKDLRELFR